MKQCTKEAVRVFHRVNAIVVRAKLTTHPGGEQPLPAPLSEVCSGVTDLSRTYRAFLAVRPVKVSIRPNEMPCKVPGLQSLGRSLSPVADKITAFTTALIEANGCFTLRCQCVVQDAAASL